MNSLQPLILRRRKARWAVRRGQKKTLRSRRQTSYVSTFGLGPGVSRPFFAPRHYSLPRPVRFRDWLDSRQRKRVRYTVLGHESQV